MARGTMPPSVLAVLHGQLPPLRYHVGRDLRNHLSQLTVPSL